MSYYRRGVDNPGCYFGLLVILASLYFVSYVYNRFGWFAGAVVVLGIISSYVLIKHIDKIKKEKNERIRLEKSCEHGILGATIDITKCSDCKQKSDEVAIQRQQERQRSYDEWKAKIRLPEYLRKMDPREFEILICNLYKKIGYEVEITRYVADGGIDGFLRRKGKLYLLQCKRVKGGVGEPILRDLYGSMVANKAEGGIVVTTGRVSVKGKQWVNDKPIEIIEIEKLKDLIRKFFSEEDVVPSDFEVDTESHNVCPKCGKPLRKVLGKHGPFFGCSNYPKCHFTKPIRKY